MRAKMILGGCIAALCAPGASYIARAADLGPLLPPAPAIMEPDPQYEFGTGWYLRGDASYADEGNTTLNSSFGKLKPSWGYGAGGGIGYKFNEMFRADITGDYLEPYEARGTDPAGNLTKLSANRYDGMVNGYFDLGNWGGLTPYIGGGVGFGVIDPSVKIVVTNLDGSQTTDRNNFSDRTNFAWAAMAGVSYAIDPNIAIDLGYRHLDLGRFSMTVAGYTMNHDMTRDEVRFGVRYMLN